MTKFTDWLIESSQLKSKELDEGYRDKDPEYSDTHASIPSGYKEVSQAEHDKIRAGLKDGSKARGKYHGAFDVRGQKDKKTGETVKVRTHYFSHADHKHDQVMSQRDVKTGKTTYWHKPHSTNESVSDHLEEASVQPSMGRFQVVHKGKVISTHSAKYEAKDAANSINDREKLKKAKPAPVSEELDEARGIKDIRGELDKHRADYEARTAALHAEMDAVRKSRGTTLKKPKDTSYHEMGRSKARVHSGAIQNESELDEVVSPFDWKKYTTQSKSDTSNSGVHKGTYGSDDHKAKGSGEPEEKKGRGRPKGTYGSYKIDPAKRDDPEYKKQLSAKVMAAKAENFKVRKEFKDSMNDAIKKHQLKLAGLDK